MKVSVYCLMGFCVLRTLCLAEGELQTWEDLQGRSFEASIVSVKPGSVRLRNAEGREVDFPTAHLLPEGQARVREWKKPEGKTGQVTEFTKKFEKDLIIREHDKVKSYAPENLAQVKYFAFYFSASWCPPCKAFTPKLVDFYDEIKPDFPEFELIFVSADQSEKDTQKYIVDYEMPWPAFKHGKHLGLVKSFGNGIPCLVVTDADGKKLLDTYTEDEKYQGPASVLRDLKKLLDKIP